MAKVLLAHPLFLSRDAAEAAATSPYFPLGLLYLAAYARDAGHEVAVFDGTFAADESAFAAALERELPDVVGISALLPTKDDALLLAAMAGERSAFVVLGGPDPTTAPEDYLAHPDVDLVVHHEGERTMVAVLDLCDEGRLDTATSLPGLAFRTPAGITVTDPPAPIPDLDALPLPARDLIDMDRYLRVWEESNGYSSLTIGTTRGCPSGCDWCRDAVHGNGFRQRSPRNVAAEMKAITDAYDVARLRMVDDVDGIDLSWLEEWADAAAAVGAAIPFEALNDLTRKDVPLLDVRDSL